MSPKMAASLAAFIISAGPAAARIGETVQQVEARYGKAISTNSVEGAVRKDYHYGEFLVAVVFLDGKSVAESIRGAEKIRRFPDDQCLALAKALSGEGPWIERTSERLVKVWVCQSKPNLTACRREGLLDADEFVMVSGQWVDYKTRQEDVLAQKFGAAPKPDKPGKTPQEEQAQNAREAQERAARARAESGARALAWHQELAAKGDGFGLTKMGMRYATGDGVPKDLAKARELLQAGVKQGNKEAAWELARLPAP